MKFVKLFVLGPRAMPDRLELEQGVRQYVSVRQEMSGLDVCPLLALEHEEKLILLTATHFVPAAFFFLLTVRCVGRQDSDV